MAYFKDFGPPNWQRPDPKFTEQDFEVQQIEELDGDDTPAEYAQFEVENWQKGGDGPVTHEVIDGVHIVRFYQTLDGEDLLTSILKIYDGPMPENQEID